MCPNHKKIFGTFTSFCIIFSAITNLFLLGFLQEKFSQEEALNILKQITVFWLFIVFILLLILWVLLRNSISPLVKLITSYKDSTALHEIDLPENISEEIKDLYIIMNSSISRLKELQIQAVEAEKNAAILMTTQMLAHDIRKPFSIIQLTIKLLSKAKSSSEIDNILKKVVPEIERSISKVNGMLIDIMDINSSLEKLNLEPTNPEFLIEQVITETFRVCNKTDIKFFYKFYHTHMIQAHALKLERVFSNILSNAIQAMNCQGNIWFHTREIVLESNTFVEFCIGNSNSFIAKENLQNIFKAFFTRCKKNGTGLGLAIAEKIILSHGGKIWCLSEKNEQFSEGKVEFYFTIPIAQNNLRLPISTLPLHSSEICKLDSVFTLEEEDKSQFIKN